MLGRLSTEYLAEASTRHPKRVISIWVSILIVAFALVGTWSGDTLTTEFAFFSNPESKQASELLSERLRGPADVNEVVIVRSVNLTVDDAEYSQYVNELSDQIAKLGEDIGSITSYFVTQNESLVSIDRHTTVLPLVLAGGFKAAEKSIDSVVEIVDEANQSSSFEVFITGEATFSKDFADGNQEDAERGEMFGIPIAMIILAVVLGAVAAAILPIVLAMVSILVALGLVLLVGQAIQLQVFVTNLITMIGLAVGIDYSLFIVSRFREERARGLPKEEAISRSGATAGRAVLFSGLTVVLAVLGILIVPHRVYFSVGLGMITVLIIAVAAALTLLPAILSIMGDSINKFRIPLLNRQGSKTSDQSGGFWNWITYAVMRRPLISLIVAAGLLIAALLPYFNINTGTSGVNELPDEFQAKQGFEVLREEFGFGLNAPAEIVIDGEIGSEPVQSAIQTLSTALKADTTFGPSTLTVNEASDLALLSVPLSVGASTEEAIAAVKEL